jgi:hypothetical protein
VDKNLLIKLLAIGGLWISVCITVDNVDKYGDNCGYCGKA